MTKDWSFGEGTYFSGVRLNGRDEQISVGETTPEHPSEVFVYVSVLVQFMWVIMCVVCEVGYCVVVPLRGSLCPFYPIVPPGALISLLQTVTKTTSHNRRFEPVIKEVPSQVCMKGGSNRGGDRGCVCVVCVCNRFDLFVVPYCLLSTDYGPDED